MFDGDSCFRLFFCSLGICSCYISFNSTNNTQHLIVYVFDFVFPYLFPQIFQVVGKPYRITFTYPWAQLSSLRKLHSSCVWNLRVHRKWAVYEFTVYYRVRFIRKKQINSAFPIMWYVNRHFKSVTIDKTVILEKVQESFLFFFRYIFSIVEISK